MLQIINVSSKPFYEEMSRVFYQMYEVLIKEMRHSVGTDTLISRHLEAAFKLSRPQKKKGLVLKGLKWMEALLLHSANKDYYTRSFEKSLLLRYIYATVLQ
jgi:hypothetical protein